MEDEEEEEEEMTEGLRLLTNGLNTKRHTAGQRAHAATPTKSLTRNPYFEDNDSHAKLGCKLKEFLTLHDAGMNMLIRKRVAISFAG